MTPPSETASLAAALAFVQANLPEIAKTQTATVRSDKGSYSYSYADLAKVSRVIVPLLGRAGLAWITKPTTNGDGKFVLAYKLLHVSGDCEEGEYPLPSSGMPQQIGSAITYARRYALCSVTGVAPETDDDDAAAAQDTQPGRTRVARRRDHGDEEPGGDPFTRPAGTAVRRARSQAGRPPLPGGPPRGDGDLIDPLGDQMKRLHASFREMGLQDRDDGLAYATGVIGRDVTSTKDLTVAEAGRIIESLVADVAARGEAGETGEQATTQQLKALGAAITRLEVSDRDARLAIVSTLAERDVTSMAELTKTQASTVLERLAELGRKPEDERRAAVEYMTAGVQPTLPEEGPS